MFLSWDFEKKTQTNIHKKAFEIHYLYPMLASMSGIRSGVKTEDSGSLPMPAVAYRLPLGLLSMFCWTVPIHDKGF